jgi:hypothetical protein
MLFRRLVRPEYLIFYLRVCSVRFKYVPQIAGIFLSKMYKMAKISKNFSKYVKNLTSRGF